MHGFQLWANLPSSSKITDARYPDISLCAIPKSPQMTAPTWASSAAKQESPHPSSVISVTAAILSISVT